MVDNDDCAHESRRDRNSTPESADQTFMTNSWLIVVPVVMRDDRLLRPRGLGLKLATELRP